jgi:hypothetical protein
MSGARMPSQPHVGQRSSLGGFAIGAGLGAAAFRRDAFVELPGVFVEFVKGQERLMLSPFRVSARG